MTRREPMLERGSDDLSAERQRSSKEAAAFEEFMTLVQQLYPHLEISEHARMRAGSDLAGRARAFDLEV